MVPVPLSTQRMKQRGYNQSERLAYGISLITGIPIDTTSVIRNVDNPTQTHISISERRRNVQGIFELADAEALQNKHVLIVDDVITTGSTTRACARAVLKAEGTKSVSSALALRNSTKKSLNPSGSGLNLCTTS